MKKQLIGLVLGALALAPFASQAHDGHCIDPFLLSGVDAQGTFTGSNPGAVSCTLNEPEAHPDTNYTVPGATHVRVGLFDDFEAPTQATLRIGDGQPIPLVWTMNTVRGRWETQSVDITGAAPNTRLVATVDVGAAIQVLTYTRL